MYYSILRPLLLTVLASLPASLVFNFLSFGICLTRCFYYHHFFSPSFSCIFFSLIFIIIISFRLSLFVYRCCDRCSVGEISLQLNTTPIARYIHDNFYIFFPLTSFNKVSLYCCVPSAEFLPSLKSTNCCEFLSLRFAAFLAVEST